MKNKVVYPGTFDPITNGHLDIIKRASKMFDEVIVAVAENKHKKPLFTLEERVIMVKNSLKNLKNVKVDSYKGLLVNYLKKIKRFIVIRGLRAFSDFEYEFQLNLINKRLGNHIEMIYMMPDETYLYISSSAVKELAYHNGPYNKFVPLFVSKKLKEKIKSY
ncbi:MAG: pantetheine-phosphate adenylyltransferase [Candidatus Goldbacteria bacterium]|nr:pantetheine-phosphate adenylyltransferase [Candidatus Goldiibacteriota bacterium]